MTGNRAPLGPYRGWALSPDAALWLALCVMHSRPRTVLELGSGTSTAVIAAAAQTAALDTTIVSLDHEPGFAARTRALLQARGMAADVRDAPLVPRAGWPHRWYDEQSLDGLGDIDLLVVDGPPDVDGLGTRAPAFALLKDRLAPGAAIFVDDADRPAEVAMVERWLAEDPSLRRGRRASEKGLALLSRREASIEFEIPLDL